MSGTPPEPQAEGIHNARRTTLHAGAKFDYVESTWTTPDGRTHARQFVRHPGSVVILPILESDAGPREGVVLIRNFRHALGREIWELPAGTRDRAESVETCASRELIEETGYSAGELIALGTLLTSPGLSDELMHAFAARRLTHVGQRPEEDEHMSVYALALPEVWRLAERGELIDAKSLATLLLAQRRGLLG